VKRAVLYFAFATVLWSPSVLAQADGVSESGRAAADTNGQTAPSPRAATAEAVQPGRAPTEQARELGRRGLTAFERGDFEAALEHFQRAEGLAHSPVFQLYAARCLLALERPDEAQSLLRAITAESLDERAPEAWRRAQAEARLELVRLEVPAAPTTEPAGTATPVGVAADGQVEQVASGTPPLPSDHPEPRSARNFWQRAAPTERGAWTAFGAGATGLVFAVITGALAVVEAAKVKENCVGTSCRLEDLPRAQHAEQLANLATVGTVVFAVGGATGTVLWLLPKKDADRAVALAVSGPGLSLSGRF